jgi:tRNA-2-methylthio-N6-dimethylallyladenosine synthase
VSEGLTAAKKLFIKTYGCQMNVYDSERIADVMRPLGYRLTEDAAEADLVVFNTCHIRERAAEKLYSDLGRLRPFKTARPNMKIAVAGCVAQAEGAEIIDRAPLVDFVVGPQSYHKLPELLARAARARGERLAADFAPQEKFDALPLRQAGGATSAFLTVQEGCDKFCTFCVVPYTRGPEFSRPAADILQEARRAVDGGVRELVLLGQNVNAYAGRGTQGGTATLADLIFQLAEIHGLARIRYTTSHPRDMGDDLIAAHRDVTKLMPYLHLPVQSGSDLVLRNMNRNHTAEYYLELVTRLRRVRPDLALSGDFIVGFPGETDAEFEATLDLVSCVGYASAYSFKYSRRPGTPAAAMANQVDEEEKTARLARLNARLGDQQFRFHQAMIGRSTPVLFERAGRKPGQVVGRSPFLQPVWVQGPLSLIGRVMEVEIREAGSGSLTGVLPSAATATSAAAGGVGAVSIAAKDAPIRPVADAAA